MQNYKPTLEKEIDALYILSNVFNILGSRPRATVNSVSTSKPL